MKKYLACGAILVIGFVVFLSYVRKDCESLSRDIKKNSKELKERRALREYGLILRDGENLVENRALLEQEYTDILALEQIVPLFPKEKGDVLRKKVLKIQEIFRFQLSTHNMLIRGYNKRLKRSGFHEQANVPEGHESLSILEDWHPKMNDE